MKWVYNLIHLGFFIRKRDICHFLNGSIIIIFLIINYLKMKKLLLFTILFSANILLAQNMSYTVYEFKVKDEAGPRLLE